MGLKTEAQQGRKKRSDAGVTAISLYEMRLVSALVVESKRANEKQFYSIKQAVEYLRGKGFIRAMVMDKKTSESRPLSDSAISRALYRHNLHPMQIMPAVSQRKRPANR